MKNSQQLFRLLVSPTSQPDLHKDTNQYLQDCTAFSWVICSVSGLNHTVRTSYAFSSAARSSPTLTNDAIPRRSSALAFSVDSSLSGSPIYGRGISKGGLCALTPLKVAQLFIKACCGNGNGKLPTYIDGSNLQECFAMRFTGKKIAQ